MKCLAYFSIICLLEFTKLSHCNNCSVGWLEYKYCCYFFHNVAKDLQGQNWPDAHMSCQRYTGNLLSIADSEENAFIEKQLIDNGNQYWIGLNDIQNNGIYEWSDNESLIFAKSKTSSLGNQDNMDCVVITSNIWTSNYCNLLLGFICKVKIAHIEQQTTYIGGIYSIETMDPRYRIDIVPSLIFPYGDIAGVARKSKERFFCVEALNGMNDLVSFQSATNMYRFIRTEDILKIQSPIPPSMCTNYSQYANDASFIVVDNMFFPGYVSFLNKNIENQLLRNDNNTFIYLQSIQDLDLYRREASFRLVKLGDCNYTAWSDWSDCSATCHNGDCGNPVKTRKKLCQAIQDSLSGDVYDFQSCNFYVPCPGSLTKWSSWESCSATCKNPENGPFQYRSRSCVDFFSYDPDYIGCVGRSLKDQQLCNQNVSCTIDPCSSCSVNAQCVTDANGVRLCVCKPGFIGNGSTCIVDRCSSCSVNAQCVADANGVRLCVCKPGFIGNGSTCLEYPDPCNLCSVNAICITTNGVRQCVCNYGFFGNGITCTNPCSLCSVNAQCVTANGIRQCVCNNGFIGNGSTCADPCSLCSVNAQCVTANGIRQCVCNNGFIGNGSTCAESLDPCSLCSVNAQCVTANGIRQCVCNNGFIGIGRSCVGFCLEQTVGDEYSGVYTFPNTPVNQLVTKSCVYNTSLIYTRQCVWNYIFGIHVWKPDVFSFLNFCPFKSGTSKQLQQIIVLERVTVTKENVVNVTNELSLIISKGSLTHVSEISRVSNILKNLININSSSNMVTKGILLIVDNLISINRDLIKQANQISNLSAVFLSQLDDLAKQQTSNTTIIMNNFGFTLYASLVNEKPIFIYSWEMKESRISVNISSSDPRDDYRHVKNYIILPSQLFRDQSEIKVYSYIFWDKTFFEKRNETIDSVILSATISGISITNSMANSTNPIKMKFSSNKTMSGYRTCRFYIVEEQIWSSKGCITTSSSSSETYCQCNHLTNFALILDVYQSEINPFSLNVLSWVGCIISIAGLFMTIVSYAAFSKLREKRAPKILLILCLNLLSTLIVFVALVERTEPPVLCNVVASMLQFFILSTFFWMAVEGFNLYRMFVKVFSNSTKSRNFLLKSAAFAWGLPLIITIATAGSKANYFKNKREYFSKICVLRGFSFYFGILLPVCLVITGNILVLTLVLRGIRKNSNLPNTSGCKKHLRAAFVCSLLLGVTWIFAVFATSGARDIFQWLFCIFNSFQGFFIFVNYALLNKQVKDHWVLFIRKKWNSLTKKYENSPKKDSPIPIKTMNTLNEEIG